MSERAPYRATILVQYEARSPEDAKATLDRLIVDLGFQAYKTIGEPRVHDRPGEPLEPSGLAAYETREFLAAWRKLPPLVRASAAARIVAAIDEVYRATLDRSLVEKSYFLHRREKVSGWIAEGLSHAALLFAHLANEGDEEAVSKGIDADVPVKP